MINVFKKKKVILVCSLFICVLLSIFLVVKKATYSINIDEVLRTSDYSYLSDVAKEYIKQVYYQKGIVLLTEKNKEENLPYLNPEYVEYLEYINGNNIDESLTYDVIPDETIVDYVYLGMSMLDNNELPSSFDLRNVDGNNFVTPVKDQGSTGLCWSFATNAQAESYLLVKNNASYEAGTSHLFSEMQIDYATASNGILDGTSFYSFSRILGDAGTFNYATTVMKDGLGLVDVNWKNFDLYDSIPMEKNKVYNFSNSKYDVLSTVEYPFLDMSSLDLSVESDVELRNSYLNTLKLLIMENGGAYVSTKDPVGRCAISVNGFRLLYNDGKCASTAHAMQIIGWDDNFEYSFCSGQKDSKQYYYLENSANCDEGTVITGSGAWLIKNSWGSLQPYVYLAYDSMNSTFNMITDMDTKDWDNNHSLKVSTSREFKATYDKNTDVLEKLNKIKFTTDKQYLDYSVCVGKSDGELNNCKDVSVIFPGIYTVDFSADNVVIDGDFTIEISSTANYPVEALNIYTNNVDEKIEIVTDDAYFKNKLTNINKYLVRVSSRTINVPENSKIDYKILDMNREEITVGYSYSENVVFANHVFSELQIDNDLVHGTYILQTIYNGNVVCESNLVVEDNIITIDGSGTEENPYIINTPSQLNLVRLDRFAFYKLGKDIDLTYDTQNENGLFYNDGKGWEPIRYSSYKKNSSRYLYFSSGFSGGFDGDNHKIIGLYINRPEEDGVGLFANTYNENYSNLHIKNISLENPMIIGNDWVGGLLGVAFGTTHERILNINNIQVNGGYIKGNNYVGGVIGLVDAGSNLIIFATSEERHILSNLYNSASISANNYAGGIFGMVTNINDRGAGKTPVKISNILNKGSVVSSGIAGGFAGYVIARDTNDISISNSMNTGVILGTECSSNIVCEFSDDSEGNFNLNNIYYVFEENLDFNNSKIIVNNVSKIDVAGIKNINSYSLWDSFVENWKLETVDEITRMPILKFVDFEYLSINDIEVNIGSKANILDYINPSIETALNNIYEISDTSIAVVSNEGVVTGVSSGNTKMHVVSYYDGYETDVDIKVNNIRVESTITFESNGGTDIESITSEIGNKVLEPLKPVKDGYNFLGWYLDNETFINKYEFTVMPNDDVVLYAKWEKLNIVVDNYNIHGNLIDNVRFATNINDYLKNFEHDNNIKIEFYNSKNELIEDTDVFVGTGSKIKVYDGNDLVHEYINVVNGDVDGDGVIKIDDIKLSAKHIIKGNFITADEYIEALDMDDNNVVNINDIIKMVKNIHN